jgi:hypothetical protein
VLAEPVNGYSRIVGDAIDACEIDDLIDLDRLG